MRGSRRFAPFVVASAAIHILALLIVANVDLSLPPPPATVRVRVVPLDRTVPRPGAPRAVRSSPDAPAALATPPADRRPAPEAAAPPSRREARRAPEPAPRATPTPAPRAAPTPPPVERPGGQIVDLPSRLRPGERAERPADSRYLSDRDRVVERQTQARVRPGAPGAPGEPGTPGDAGEAPAAPAQPAPPPAPRGEPAQPPALAGAEEPRPAPEPPRSVARAEPPAPQPAPPAPGPPARPEPPAAQGRPSEPAAAGPPAPGPGPAPSREPQVARAPEPPARPLATPPAPREGRIARLEPSRPPAPPSRPEAPRAEPDARRPAPQAPGRAAPGDQPRDALPAAPGTPAARGSRASPRPDDGDADDASPRRLPGREQLIPRPEQIARARRPEPPRPGTGGGGGQGGTGPRDYLPGVEEGDETFLNSREFRYAYYFNWVKQAIGAHWSPSGALERAYPGGVSLPSELFTELTIVVEKDGRVAATDMTRASGVGSLDQEAVRAVRAAGQFPAPPAGVLDPDGRLRFQFGFVVTTGGGRLTFYGPDDQDLRSRFRDPFGRSRAPRAR